MSFREELIEAMADQYARWRQGIASDEEVSRYLRGPYEGAMDNARTFMPLALDAALAYRRSEVCPTCGGTDSVPLKPTPNERLLLEAALGEGEYVQDCPDCIDGRRSVEYPRLAVVGEQVATQDAVGYLRDVGYGEEGTPVFSLHQEEAER